MRIKSDIRSQPAHAPAGRRYRPNRALNETAIDCPSADIRGCIAPIARIEVPMPCERRKPGISATAAMTAISADGMVLRISVSSCQSPVRPSCQSSAISIQCAWGPPPPRADNPCALRRDLAVAGRQPVPRPAEAGTPRRSPESRAPETRTPSPRAPEPPSSRAPELPGPRAPEPEPPSSRAPEPPSSRAPEPPSPEPPSPRAPSPRAPEPPSPRAPEPPSPEL